MSALCSGLPGKVDRKMQHAASVIAGRWIGLRSTLRQARHLSLSDFALRLFLNQDAVKQMFCTPILSQETN